MPGASGAVVHPLPFVRFFKQKTYIQQVAKTPWQYAEWGSNFDTARVTHPFEIPGFAPVSVQVYSYITARLKSKSALRPNFIE